MNLEHTFDVKFRLEFEMEDRSPKISCRGNEVQSVHIILIKCQDRGFVCKVVCLEVLQAMAEAFQAKTGQKIDIQRGGTNGSYLSLKTVKFSANVHTF
jgi:hypothetical protein